MNGIRRRFMQTLWILQDVHAYYVPTTNRIVCRSTLCQRPLKPPHGSIYLGRYSYPCPAEDFLADLEALRSRLRLA